MENNTSKPVKNRIFLLVVILSLLVVTLSVILVILVFGPMIRDRFLNPGGSTPTEIQQFSSDSDFKTFINTLKTNQRNSFSANAIGAALPEAISAPIGTGEGPAIVDTNKTTADRFSTTNVQVAGIDEPDIVKTDGKNIYLSNLQYLYYPLDMPAVREGSEDSSSTVEKIMPPEEIPVTKTKVISALPATNLKLTAELEATGNLLISDNTLIVLGYQKITGFDISNAASPREIWNITYDTNTSVLEARLFNNELYLITQTYLNYEKPCPVRVMQATSELVVPCTDIYYPIHISSADTTFTIAKVNISNGGILDKTSFLGQTSSSVIYMSENNIYLTFYQQESYYRLISGLIVNYPLLFPLNISNKLRELDSYNISDEAKLLEISTEMETWFASYQGSDLEALQQRLSDASKEYITQHKRELETTTIVRIANSTLDLDKRGSVPGSLLNQFSLDEYQGYLRLAVNLGNYFGGSDSSSNEIYILDNNLNKVGEVIDLGLEERIYAIRFLADKAYLVTFKQVDPFYILDLSNPTSPKVTGQLKIPGYSSYLHPLADNLVLGVGMEEGHLKLSLFEVSDVTNPRELDKLQLDEYSSEVLYNHKAFLHDPENKIFFIPSYYAGYVYSYQNDRLSLQKKEAGENVERAVFINDNLYLISNNKISVLAISNWSTVSEFSF